MQHTFIILIPVGEASGISESRGAAEGLENTIFTTDKVISNYEQEVKAKVLHELGLETATFDVHEISYFMDLFNNQELNADDYFLSYVHLKVTK